jgi:uncharacterized membrane protein YhdT
MRNGVLWNLLMTLLSLSLWIIFMLISRNHQGLLFEGKRQKQLPPNS